MFGDGVLNARVVWGRSVCVSVVVLLVQLAAVLALAGSASAGTNPASISSAVQIAPRVVELTIDTPAFTTPTKVHVDLPTNYDAEPGRRWPTAYFLAGTQNTYRSFNSVIGGVALTADFPAIVVSPNGDSGYWSDWSNNGAGGPPMYETYVIDQLIPLIDGFFRTNPDRSQRAIAGVSMGGYGALMLAARHPDVFASAASISGTLNTNLLPNAAAVSLSSALQGGRVDAIYGPRAIEEVRWRGHNPADLAENFRGIDLQVRGANGVLNPRIGEKLFSADLVSCVVEAGAYASTRSMHSILKARAVPHLWKDYGAGCHTPPNFKRQVSDTLDVFAEKFTNPDAVQPSFTHRAIEPRFDVWGWEVAADPERPLEFLQLDDVGPTGATLTGSGTTTVISPPMFRGRSFVRLAGATSTWARANAYGRIKFEADLGRPNRIQQYRLGARTSTRTRTVKFYPWPASE